MEGRWFRISLYLKLCLFAVESVLKAANILGVWDSGQVVKFYCFICICTELKGFFKKKIMVQFWIITSTCLYTN